MTISDLNNFIMTAEPQVIGIDEDEGWCYIGCSQCAKKLVREISSFTCVVCNVTNAVAALRYRVTMSVSDNTDTASFMGFDMEMAKLTNIQASDAGQIEGNGVDAQVSTPLPPSLGAIIGKTYTFQLRLKDFNFSSKHQTFTISRIFAERVLAPMPAFEEIGRNHVDAVDKTLALGADTVPGKPSNAADEPYTSDTSGAKRPPPVEANIGILETALKKPHVE